MQSRERFHFNKTMKIKLHCSESVSFCYNHFRTCPPTILSWNPKTESFHRSEAYKLWITVLTLAYAGMSGGTCSFVIFSHSLQNFTLVLLALVFLNCIVMCFPFGLVVFFYCEDIVLAFEAMKRLLTNLNSNSSNFPEDEDLQKLDHKWKFFSLFVRLSVASLIPMKWLMTPFLMFHNLDPYYGLLQFQQWLPNSLKHIIRAVCLMISFNIGAQIYGIIITIIFLWLEMQSKCLHHLAAVNNAADNSFFMWYTKFHVASKIWKDAISLIIQIYMGSMLGGIVICNVVTIRYFGEVPFTVFWFMPTVAAVNSVMFYIIFPFLTGCVEQTHEMIHEKKRRMVREVCSSTRELKWGRVKAQSLKPIAMHCGGTFPLKKHTKREFLLAIVERTLDGILL